MSENTVTKEFCSENFTDIPLAVVAGAKRIELCDNLAEGGTTPSYGVIKKSVAYCDKMNIPVMTMIRPRGGDFEYNADESEMMLNDIEICKKLGSSGVVFGCLRNGKLDNILTEKLISAAAGMDITFHMAFDVLEKSDQFKAIDWLAERGVQRILTHGSQNAGPIENNFEHLKRLVEYANKRLIILPGAGIRYDNFKQVLDMLQVREVHGTKIVELIKD